MAGHFAFGGHGRARFTGVACFFTPGILRIADVRDCAPAATFYTNTFDIPERQQAEGFPGITTRSTWFMVGYTGVFTVRAAGSYEFRLHSDDGSYLLIDGEAIIDNDGKHKPESRRGSARLGAGEHHLKLLYAQTTDRMALQLYVRRPPATRCCSRRTSDGPPAWRKRAGTSRPGAIAAPRRPGCATDAHTAAANREGFLTGA